MSALLDILISDCYLALLRIPPTSPLRAQNDALMARCRDHFAARWGEKPEDVQNEFERKAAQST